MVRRVAFVIALLLVPATTWAQPINLTVHNTGVNSGDVLVSPGAQTSFWTMLTAPAGATETVGSNAFRYFNGAYVPDSSTAAWVSMSPSGDASVAGIYVYQLLVDLSAVNPATVVITGQFSTDNDGFIRLNGGANVATSGFAGFGALTSFTLNSGFIPGMNSIQVGVNNGSNPTAFRVQFSSATGSPIQVPTMPGWFLLILAAILASMVVVMLRRRADTSTASA